MPSYTRNVSTGTMAVKEWPNTRKTSAIRTAIAAQFIRESGARRA